MSTFIIRSISKSVKGVKHINVDVFRKLISECRSYATVRMYALLATKPRLKLDDGESYVIIRPMQLQRELGISHQTTYAAMHWLITNGYIERWKIDGNSAFKIADHTDKVINTVQVAANFDHEIQMRHELILALEEIIGQHVIPGLPDDEYEGQSPEEDNRQTDS